MHDIEPFFNWRGLYRSDEDALSPFYQREYSEFYFTNQIYDHLIHPQWDEFGSPTLYLKVLFTDYKAGYAIIELLGEWNDCINNDIMYLKREVIDVLVENGVNKFIMIGENVLNFHASDDSYYEEWFDEVEEGWIAYINFRPHVLQEMSQHRLDYYTNSGGQLDDMKWRTLMPHQLFQAVEKVLSRRLT